MEPTGRTPGRGLAIAALVTILALTATSCTSSGSLLPEENAQMATSFTGYEQVVDAFDQIHPGQATMADLAFLGFDPRQGNVQVISYLGIEDRFLPHNSFKFDRLDPAVQACILAETQCMGYVFHPEHTATKRIGNAFLDVMGFRRVTRSDHWSAEVILLVNNGVVVHKVFSGSPSTRNLDDKVQPLGPVQDVGTLLLQGAAAASGY